MAEFHDRRAGGRVYTFQPHGFDAFTEFPTGLKAGDQVRLSNKSGVGQLKGPFRYVEHAETGEFHGMVNRSSLGPKAKAAKKKS